MESKKKPIFTTEFVKYKKAVREPSRSFSTKSTENVWTEQNNRKM
jgi:hypothetical protein